MDDSVSGKQDWSTRRWGEMNKANGVPLRLTKKHGIKQNGDGDMGKNHVSGWFSSCSESGDSGESSLLFKGSGASPMPVRTASAAARIWNNSGR